jgi:hypothetical protein
VRDSVCGAPEQGTIFPVLKVPRQCPLVLLAEVMHVKGINFYMTSKGCIIGKLNLALEGLYYGEICMQCNVEIGFQLSVCCADCNCQRQPAI